MGIKKGHLNTNIQIAYVAGGGMGVPVIEIALSSSSGPSSAGAYGSGVPNSVSQDKINTVTGTDRQGLTVALIGTSYQPITTSALTGTSGGGKKAYVYIKNLSGTGGPDVIIADDGGQIFARLDHGEFCFYPSADNVGVQVKSSEGTCTIEYMYYTQV
tara:strand:- start:3702 stop:4175 length:474 start_codon:yes stop_codon:yes gene_type:complete